MADIDIHVKKSGIVPRTLVAEGSRGGLFASEEKQLPFRVRRVYAISGVGEGISRGGHAHKQNDQAMFVLRGALTLHLDDGEDTQSVRLSNTDEGVRLAPMLWHSMDDFTEDCVVLVLASLPFDESDYIHDYNTFKGMSQPE